MKNFLVAMAVKVSLLPVGMGLLLAGGTPVSVTQYFVDEVSLGSVSPARAGSVSLDSSHFLWGGQTLRWEWQGGDQLEVDHPFVLNWTVDPDGVVYAPVFELNVYSESPVEDVLTIRIGDATFTFGLDFTGWRSAQVRYYGDMEGVVADSGEGYTIIAPKEGSGVVWLDGVNPGSFIYEALAQPDWQVPYIQDGLDEHRRAGMRRSNMLTMALEVDALPATAEEVAATETIINRVESQILSIQPRAIGALDAQATEILEEALPLRSRRQLGLVQPRPKIARPADFYALMLDYAKHYKLSGDSHARAMYFRLLDYSRDQGWVEGSVLGSLHLTGYEGTSPRAQSSLLMRDELEQEGMLETVARDMQWQMNSRECLILPTHEGNLDYMHTFMIPQLLSFLVVADENERVAWVKAYQHYVNAVIGSVTNDDEGGFKPDGAAFHHYGHYPLYAAGAYEYVAELKEILAGTPFALSDESLALMKKSLAVVEYNILEDGSLPISLSGRHPFLSERWVRGIPALMDQLGVEKLPDDLFLVVNNAALATHGRPAWQVVMRGLSAYVWGAEIFPGNANRYGVFNNHGTVEVMSLKGLKESGYDGAGWDWRKLPGATTVLAPYAIIKDFPFRNKKSDQTFAGGLTLDDLNGQFAVFLSDAFFGLQARKSVFCFDDVVVALGSGITCYRQNYDTVTTLFQNAIDEPIELEAVVVGEQTLLRDAVGNAYLVKNPDSVVVYEGVQDSFDQGSAKPTSGSFYTAWLNHGRRPTDAEYAYFIFVQSDDVAVEKHLENPRIEILRQDKRAHIVRDRVTGITAATLFESTEVEDGLLRFVSKPCLVQLRQIGTSELELAVCDPDLQWGRASAEEIRIELEGDWSIPEQDGFVFSHIRDGRTSIILRPVHGERVLLRGMRLR